MEWFFAVLGVMFAASFIWMLIRLINHGELKSRLIGAAFETIGVLALLCGIFTLAMIFADPESGKGPFPTKDEIVPTTVITVLGGVLAKIGVWLRRA